MRWQQLKVKTSFRNMFDCLFWKIMISKENFLNFWLIAGFNFFNTVVYFLPTPKCFLSFRWILDIIFLWAGKMSTIHNNFIIIFLLISNKVLLNSNIRYPHIVLAWYNKCGNNIRIASINNWHEYTSEYIV